MLKKKQRPLPAVAAIALALGLSGCAALWVAGGAAAGHTLTRDSMSFTVEDRSLARVWEVAVRETRRRGTVKAENPGKGRLEAQVEDADVVVTLEQLTLTTVRVKVRARRALLPRRRTAERLGLAILRELY